MRAQHPLTSLIRTFQRTSLSSSKLETTATSYICPPCRYLQQRSLHQRVKALPVPAPTPFVPDVSTFLTLIGRQLNKHSSKFTKWEDLFTLSSSQLKEMGIEPARSRKYLLRWREKFRRGEYGIGGDFQYVQNGVGEVRLVQVPRMAQQVSTTTGSEGEEQAQSTPTSPSTRSSATTSTAPGMLHLILNTPPSFANTSSESYKLLLPTTPGHSPANLHKPAHLKLHNGHTIVGSHVQPLKGSHAGDAVSVKVAEGLWEDKRGHKVHGGERRQAMILHKERVAERRKSER